MNRPLLYFVFVFFMITSKLCFAAVDNNVISPSKDNLLAAWESNQKSQPTTVTFEKTGEKNIYNFETTLFPYKGRLKILNIFIDKNVDDYPYDYDVREDALVAGAIETELMDASEDFLKKYLYSGKAWEKQNILYFITNTGSWMTEDRWQEYDKTHSIENEQANIKSNKSRTENIIRIVAFSFLILLIFSLWRTRKVQKSYIAKYDISMSRQLEAMKIAEQSLALQREQNELLHRLVQK